MSLSPAFSRFQTLRHLLVPPHGVKPLNRLLVLPAPSSIKQQSVAEEVAKCVRGQQQHKDSVLIINNPGSTDIVRSFKNLGVKHIACTGIDKLKDGNLQRALADKVVFCSGHDVMTVSPHQLEEEIISQLPVPITETGVTILSTLNQQKKATFRNRVFSVMVAKCLSYPGLLDTPKTEFFIFLTQNKYKKLSGPLFSSRIYNAFFNISHVMELDSSNFEPKLVENKGAEKVHLVHFTPNQAILSQLSIEDRKKYKKFVKFCLRKDTIITFMDHHVPGCGIHLIKMGFTMSDENMTMTADQYVAIYKSMHTWPEFEDSSLNLILEDKPFNTLPGEAQT